VLIESGHSPEPNLPYIATIIKNIENLGYTLSPELIAVLKTKDNESLERFYLNLVTVLKKLVGDNVSYRPVYPNFPEQVMNASEAELLINAIVHYWSYGSLLPQYEKLERLPLLDKKKVNAIDIGNDEEFKAIFINLMSAKTSLSQTDKDDLEWFFKNCGDYKKYLPAEIPHKENVSLIGKLIIENSPLVSANDVRLYFKTATDVLRLITAMSNGDISLAQNCKFRSFKRRERRLLLDLLEDCRIIEEDMLRYKNRWIRVGERLHPSEYNGYEASKEAFGKLRNNGKIETFGGKVVKSINSGQYVEALMLLKNRPGELARKLDYLLRITDDEPSVIKAFEDVANNVSTPVLLQVREHFKKRNHNKSDIRIFFPKGNAAKAQCIKNKLPDVSEKYCADIACICESALIEAYRQRKSMGKVYLNEDYKNYLVPFSQRSASKSLKTITRGSKIPLAPNVKTVRSFIWWKNGESRTDIDLSAVMYDSEWQYKEHISYTNLRSAKYKACHSGDIVNAPVGASEFIDIDIESAVNYGARYIVMSVLSFTRQPFSDLPECFVGWMERENPGSGEIFEPKTVRIKSDLTSKTQICVPVIVDLVKRAVIWCDIGVTRNPDWHNNIEGNQTGIVLSCRALTELIKPDLYDLISLHIKARGIQCDEKENADIIFDLNEGITPFDTEIFMAEYM